MLNDKDYWDNRFNSGDWDNYCGREQTQFFYEIAINNIPDWLKNEINNNKWSICDLGCAEGDGTQLIHQEFSNSNITGLDFSQSAINKAKELFSSISFLCSDICSFNNHFDIIFSSNTLEHFKDPEKVLGKMLSLSDKYLILLIPFQENDLHEEHFTSFNYNNFHLQLDNYQLLFYKEIDTENISKTYWQGKQILIIYGNTKNLEIQNFTLEESNNQYFDEYLHKIEETKTIENELLTVEQERTFLNEEKSILKEEIRIAEKEKIDLELEINDLNFQRITAKSDLEKNKIIGKKKDLLINDLLTNIQRTNTEIEKINNTKPYKLAYFIRRLSHEFIKGNWDNKKTFIRWITSKLTKRHNIPYNSQHNPLIQLKKFNLNKIKRIKLEKRYALPNFYEKIKFDSNKRQIDKILQNDYEFVSLFVLKCGWNMNLFQRPQHISLNFTNLGGLVLFRGAFDGVDRDMDKPIHKIEDNLYLIDMDDKKLLEYLLKKLETVKKPKILHLYSTDNGISLYEIKKYEKSGFKILYEYIDEISSEVSKIQIPSLTYKKHEFILQNSNYYVVTSAGKLYDTVHNVRGNQNLIMASNGVEYEHWDLNVRESQLPKDIKEIVKKKTPIIGYYGAIASWIDFDLIEKLLIEYPDYEIVFIGEIFNTKLSENISNKYPNFHFLGPKNYYDLNIYAKNFA